MRTYVDENTLEIKYDLREEQPKKRPPLTLAQESGWSGYVEPEVKG